MKIWPSQLNEMAYFMPEIVARVMGIEPTTTCLGNSCYTVSGSISISTKDCKSCLYLLQLYPHYSPRWYKNWYSESLATTQDGQDPWPSECHVLPLHFYLICRTQYSCCCRPRHTVGQSVWPRRSPVWPARTGLGRGTKHPC